MAKNNIRSVRFSDEMIEIINQQIGDNFTRKFERMVYNCYMLQPEKQRQLGKLCLMGEGVPKNKGEAQYWFSAAEQNGHTCAGYFLDRMERREDLPPPDSLLSAAPHRQHLPEQSTASRSAIRHPDRPQKPTVSA